MKKNQIFLLLFLFFIFQICYSAEPIDLSKIKWGMTPDDVLKAEDNYFLINHTIKEIPPGYIILSAHQTKVAGIDSILSYTFKDEKLISASYWFLPTDRFKFEHTKDLFFDDYKLVQEDLKKYYGEPDMVTGEWQCRWEKDKTIIIHLIQEKLGDASHGILFYDTNVWKELEKIGLSN